MSSNEAFAWSELPEIVVSYLKPHLVQDYTTAMTFLAEDATVIDNGETFENREAALRVFNESAEQYDVTTTPHWISKPSDTVWEVGTHLSGNFPGGEVDLRMLFTLVDNTIQKLEITV